MWVQGGRFKRPCASFASSSSAAEKRPNILFILVDDQSPFDLKMYNPLSTLETPNLDKLAAQGMVFDGAYHMGASMGAVCMPSRHMIVSGRTVWHLPVSPWAAKTSPPNLGQDKILAVLNRAGHATMRTCKQGNSYEPANELFAVRHDASKRGGTDESGSAWHAEQVRLREREKRRRKGSERRSWRCELFRERPGSRLPLLRSAGTKTGHHAPCAGESGGHGGVVETPQVKLPVAARHVPDHRDVSALLRRGKQP